MDTLRQDITVGCRMLLRSPVFTMVATATLALGIGANTIIFSVVNAVLLHAVPYKDADQLVQLWSVFRSSATTDSAMSRPDLGDVQAETTVFEGLAFYRLGTGMTLTDAGPTKHVSDVAISPNLFSVLNVVPFLGRCFLPDETLPGRDHAVIVSYSLWKELSNSGKTLVGTTIRLNNEPYTVVGVLPPHTGFPNQFVDLWTPESSVSDRVRQRGLRDTFVIGRMKNSVVLRNAEAELQTVASRLASQYPEDEGLLAFNAAPLQEHAVAPIRLALVILLGAVGLVLLIACANVANLVLVRNAAREREVAVRVALGASRLRIVRQFFVESLLLALTGGCAALIVSAWGVHIVRGAAVRIPRLDGIGVDGRVFAFNAIISVLTGVAFGLIPALNSSKPDLTTSLKEGAMNSQTGFGLLARHRIQSTLVVSQVSLAVVLAVGAGLLARSLSRLLNVKVGFIPGQLLTVRLSEGALVPLGEKGTTLFYNELLRQTSALPGVTSAALVSTLPIGNRYFMVPFTLKERPKGLGQNMTAQYQVVSPDYFKTMGIRILKGRSFTELDTESTPSVAAVNTTLAKRFWPGRDPLAQQIDLSGQGHWTEIIGVVDDARDINLETQPPPEMYFSYLQSHEQESALLVRTTLQPLSLGNAVVNLIWTLDKDERVLDVSTMEDVISRSITEPRLRTMLLGAFAILALALATVGIYGVIAYSVTQRVHEIGIRMALGAQRSDVLHTIVAQGLVLGLIGTLLGLAGASCLTHVLSRLLYGIQPLDPVTFVVVAIVLAVVTCSASYIPARRAANVDPIVALRYE